MKIKPPNVLSLNRTFPLVNNTGREERNLKKNREKTSEGVRKNIRDLIKYDCLN